VHEPSDIALIHRIADRDATALRALYDRHGRVAFALAYRVTGNAQAAEEVVQDAFEIAWTRAATFDTGRGGNVRGWLLTITHRRAIDSLRREQSRAPGRVALDDVEHRLSTPDAWGEVSSTLLAERVQAAMADLPPDQRRSVELAYFEGLTHGEIAAREDTPLGTVKGRLRLGLRKLSESLAGERENPTGIQGERKP
jgi:RNA polymerase sigma-70 factor (ECF subfamily)